MELEQTRAKALTTPSALGWKRVYRDIVKRLADSVLAFLALICMWPVMIVIGVLIQLDSPGPALFVQQRIGKFGRPFRIYKFRTMTHKLDNSAHIQFMQAFVQGRLAHGANRPDTTYKPFSKSQVTRVGRFLRRTSLDELPQLFNVLKGDMSLVGPRPNVPYEVQAYKEWHRERLSVLPGITGLAQVKGRSSLDFDTIAEYDIRYARRVSLGLDVQILLSTLSTVVKGKGAH